MFQLFNGPGARARATLRAFTSRASMRFAALFLSFALLYILVLDTYVRPPTRFEMGLEDFEEAEVGIPEPPMRSNGSDSPSRVLLVSAMFPLTKSKHSTKDYEDWLGRFLGSITTDIYMYTTPEMASLLMRLRSSSASLAPRTMTMTLNTSYSSPFQVPPLRGLEETYTRMNAMDKEKWHHSPGLYAVWNAKPFLLNAAVKHLQIQGQEYEYAFWNDGGSFRRNHDYRAWPDPGRIDQVWKEAGRLTGRKEDELLFFPIFQLPDFKYRRWTEGMGPIANSVQFSEGSFFGGSPATIAWFSRIFYAYHRYYLSRGLFVGIDQDIFNALFLLFPERIFTVWMNDPQAPAHKGITPSPSLKPSLERGYLGECGAEWFYYQFWVANRAERDVMRMIWLREERWRKWGWWKERKLCRMTRAMSMMDVLQRSFGENWKPPRKTIIIPGESDSVMSLTSGEPKGTTAAATTSTTLRRNRANFWKVQAAGKPST